MSIYIAGSGFSFFTAETPMHVLIKDEIVKQTYAMTGRKISIGKVSGGLLNSVTLEDVKIPKEKSSSAQNVITVKKAVIRYNLMKAAFAKDIIPSIYKIDLYGASVQLERDARGEWNLVKLVAGDGSGGPPPVFKARIEIKSGTLYYADEAGFSPPLKERFVQKFDGVEATINLSKKDIISFKIFGVSGNSSIRSDGKINLAHKEKGKKAEAAVKADINVKATSLPIALWNPYLGIPGLKDTDIKGSADLNLKTSVSPSSYYVEGEASISNGTVYGRQASGRILISLKDNKAKIELGNALFCGGKISGGAKFDISEQKVKVSAQITSDKTDVSSLLQDIAPSKGRASARINADGGPDDLLIDLNVDLSGADIYGIKPNNIILSGNLKKDVFSFDKFSVTTAQSKLFLTGLINGLEGGKFIKDPLKHAKISGTIDLRNEMLFGQKINAAKGSIRIDEGSLDLGNMYLVSGASRVDMSCRINPGKVSDISIFASDIRLSDYPSITAGLPKEFREIKGSAAFEANISGTFPEKLDKNIIGKIASLKGRIALKAQNVVLARQQITSAEALAIIDGGQIKIEKAFVSTKNSYANAGGFVNKKGEAAIDLTGTINLVDLSPFTQKYAKILGIASVSAHISGSLLDPAYYADFTVLNPSYNEVKADKISGKLNWSAGVLKTDPGIKVELMGDSYDIFARADLRKTEPDISARVYTNHGGLGSAISIAQMAYIELIERKGIAGNPSKVLIYAQKIALPSIFDFRTKNGLLIYTPDDAFLKAWARSIKRAETLGKKPGFLSGIKAEGPMGCDIKIEIKGQQAHVTAGVSVENGKVGAYEFDKLTLSADLIDGRLNLHKLSLEKGRGMFEASGSADINGPIKINAYAKNLKLDGIESAFVSGFPVEGFLSGTFEARGTTAIPVLGAQLNLTDAGFGGLSLRSASGKFVFSLDKIEINRLELGVGKQKTMIKGTIPFTNKDEIDLKIKLSGENTGLIASLIKGVEWEGGSGSVEVAVSGRITHPKVDGTVFLKDVRINIDQIKSSVYDLNVDLRARDNYFEVKRLSGILQGQITQGKNTPFSFAGYADLSRVFGRTKDGDINLAMADSDINIEIPGLYSGGILINGASLKGKFHAGKEISYREKPLFKASVMLHDGSISIPQVHGSGEKQVSPMVLDLLLGIGKNVNIVQGQSDRLISTDMSNMNIEITASGLTVKGGLFSPVIEGDVNIVKGSLSILSRDFTILSKAEQEKYFINNPSLAQDNTARFLGGAIYGAVPTINVTALSEVSVLPDTAAGSSLSSTGTTTTISTADIIPPQKQKVYIITKVSGMPGVTEMGKTLNIVFYPFIEDKARIPSQIVSAPYSESQVRMMLIPDFIKDALGVSKGGTSGIEANAILIDYANRRFQSMISSTVGSRIERALGLESFYVSYNVGRDLERLLPTSRGRSGYSDTPQLGVGFVKGFFGRIFIQMRYSQTIEQVDVLNPTSLNYQLTYMLSPIWSLVYYREPITFQEQSSTYYKTMLQAAYKL